ncbi:arylesterase [Peptococcaceae bacterium CEB3]|nr:arylesterase [Peptococcaceae bacterium CEB3]
MEKPEVKRVQLANGETLGYRVCGQGERTIVLIHGNLVSSKYWERLMPAFPSQYTVYALDMRGVGESSYNRPINSVWDFADDVRQFIEGMNLKRFILVGWSMGGGVSQLFTAQYPALVEKLVLLDSVSVKGFPYPDPDNGKYLKTREEVLTKGAGDLAALLVQGSAEGFRAVWDMAVFNVIQPDEDWYKELIDDILTCRFFPDSAWAMHNFNLSNENNGVLNGNGLVDRITMPVLVIRGDNDMIVTQEMVDETVGALGPTAQLQVMADCGHAVFIDKPKEFMSRFEAFVE